METYTDLTQTEKDEQARRAFAMARRNLSIALLAVREDLPDGNQPRGEAHRRDQGRRPRAGDHHSGRPLASADQAAVHRRGGYGHPGGLPGHPHADVRPRKTTVLVRDPEPLAQLFPTQ